VLFPCWRKLSGISVGISRGIARARLATIVRSILLPSKPLTNFSRVRSFCLASYPSPPLSLSFSLFLSVSLSLYTFILHRCKFRLHWVFKRANEQGSAQSLSSCFKLNQVSFCQAVGFRHLFCSPGYLTAVISHSSATFYVSFGTILAAR
jgi:hypothetical protein